MHLGLDAKWQEMKDSERGLYVVYDKQKYYLENFGPAMSPRFSGEIAFSPDNGIFLQLHKNDPMKAKVIPYSAY